MQAKAYWKIQVNIIYFLKHNNEDQMAAYGVIW